MKKKIGSILQKIGLKKKAVQLNLSFSNRHKKIERDIRMFLIPRLVKKRSKSGYYAIDFDSDWNGFGSRVIKTLEILLYCETNKLIPVIKFSYREKIKPQTDYFREIFFYKTTLQIDEKKLRFTKIRDNDELKWEEDYNQKLHLSFAKSLFDKYLGINKDVLNEVEMFKNIWFKNKKVLGVHFRGTDKAGEAPLVTKEKLVQHINEIINEEKDFNTIFLSTDDEKIIKYLESAELELPVIYRKDILRSTDGNQFHRIKENSKSLVNRDAIVNCLLLSDCNFLLKTASILSDCSVVFNPTMRVKVISFPHSRELTWWPATEIKQNQENNIYAVVATK